jgi:hypothetical protein
LLHPRLENRALLGALNVHDASEVAEYSVWALWKSPRCSLDDLQIPQHALLDGPENVRRWINRLIAKHPQFLVDNLDLFDDLYADESLKAREGLALGLRDVHLPELEPRVLSWFSREPNADLRELILEHLALSESSDTTLFDLLFDAYSRAGVESGLRRRLRAAVGGRGGNLFQAFNRVEAAGFMTAGSATLFSNEQPRIGTIAVNSKTVNNNTINVGGNLTAQNISGGDLFAVANESVQQLKQKDADVASVLEQIIALTKGRDAFDNEQTAQLISAVSAVAREPTPANKGKLLDTLKAVASTVSDISATTNLPELIALVSSWL